MSRLSVYRLGIIQMQDRKIQEMEAQLSAKDTVIATEREKVTALEKGLTRANGKIGTCENDRRALERKLLNRNRTLIVFGSITATLAASLAIVAGVK